MVVAVLVGGAASAGAQVIGFTADPVNTQYGTYADNGGAGGGLNIGRTMTVTGAGIEVFQLGVYDYQSDGLAQSHVVTLFNNQTAVASVTIPAGTAAPLMNAFRFEPLATPIYLSAGNYSIVAYQMNGTTTQASDPYGNGNAAGFNGGGNVSPGAGIYDFVTSPSPAYPTQSSGEDFAAVSFTYTNAIAGSSTWTGLGANNNWSTPGNWNSAPSSPAGLTFAGSTRLTNTNDLLNLVATGITFDAAAGAFVLDGNAITLGGSLGFNGRPAASVTQTINLNMDWSTSEIIDTPTNGNLNFGGNITSSSDTSLIKLDVGTLTLGGTNLITSMDLNGGTTTITGNTTVNGDGGSRIYVGDGDYLAGCNGTLIIQPGATLTFTGNFADAFVLGRDSGSGTITQNGGTFTFSPGNQSLFLIAATGDTRTRAEFDMNGGLFNMSGNTLGAGWGNVVVTGVVNQVGGVITNLGNLRIPFTGGGNGLGVYTLSGGSIYIGANGITSDGARYAINLGGGTVGAEASWSSPLNMNLTGNNGAVTFNPAGNVITLSGGLSGNGGLIVAGGGTLELSGANTYKGDTTVNGGSTLQLDGTGSSLGAFRLANNGTLYLNFSGNYAVAHFYTNGVALPIGTYNNGNLPAFITGSGNLVVASSISTGRWTGLGANNNWSTGGNWDQNTVPIFPIGLTFAGSTQLLNNNDLSGITANSITFDIAAGAFVLDGNAITLTGNIGFNGNPASPVTQTVNLDMTWNASETIDTPTNGNLSLGGDITSSVDTSLIKLDAGTLTLGGTNTIASWDLNGGTTTITGNTTINGDNNGRIYVGDGDAINGCSGTLIIQNGATLTINGNFADAFVIGRDSGSGTVIQNGGTFTYDADNGYLFVGATSETGTRAEYDMNGGLLDMNGNTLGIGLGDAGVTDTGLVSQVSGVIDNVLNLQLGAVRSYGYGIYTLSGGSMYIGGGGITTTSGKYLINLGGGTLGAYQSWSSPLNMNLTNLNGSVTFDTAGNLITLSGTLSGTGGLTVTGSGTLELSGANSYAGDTIVNAGSTLQLDVTGSSTGKFHVVNGSYLNLNYSGTFVVAGLYTNGVAVAVGTYNSGNLPNISGSGNLQVVTSVSTGVWTGLGVNNNWSAAGNWNQDAEPIFPIGLTFAGSTRLVNTNDLSGITVSSLTFDVAAGAFVLNGDDITLGGNILFNGNPATPVTQTVNLNMALSSPEVIDTPAHGNLSLDGNLTSSVDTSLTKLDAGTLTLGGINTIMSWDLDGGTTTITGNTMINGDGGSRIYVGDGDYLSGCNGTLIIQPGAVLDIIGNYADAFVIGRDSGSGTVIQNGGTFTFNPNASPGYLFVGATSNPGTQSAYDMNGGVLDMSGHTLSIALDGNGAVTTTGVVYQVGGVITNVGNLWLSPVDGGGLGIYTLSGGSIYIEGGGITTATGNYIINLGGGTVGAEASWSSPLKMNLTNLNGSVTFNPAGNTITLSGTLSGNGGLNVAGSGTLKLSGAYSYTGVTTVNASTLELDETGSSQGAVYLANGAVLNLNFSGANVVAACYTNGVALANGSYNASNLAGFITGAGVLTVGTIPTAPTPISYSVSSGHLTINWPANYLGWILQSQTNGLKTGLGTNWVDVAGSAGVISTNIPISTATPTVFYRLRYPQ
jgi:autotransporter-associated beta strand protein